MGSKTNINTTNVNDQSQIQALAAVRGDGNTTNILDGDAIKLSYQYASQVNDNNSNNIGQVLNTIDSVTGRAFAASAEQSNKAISALQDGISHTANGIQLAYSKAQNQGFDPQMLLLGLAGLLAVGWLMKR